MPDRLPGRRRAAEVLAEMGRGSTPAGAKAAISSGSIGYAAGGPVWLDQFRSKRAPSPTELPEQYKSIAYACVNLNGRGVAQTPLRLYCKTGPRDRAPRRDVVPVPPERLKYLRKCRDVAGILRGASAVDEVAEHPFLEALARPNPYFDGSLFVFYLSACLDALGRFYFFPVRPDRSWAAREWWPLQPQYVMPVKGEGPNILRHYTYFGQTFDPDELETGRMLSLRDPYLSGYAPMHACFEQLGLVNYYTAVVESTLRGGARPSAIVGQAPGPGVVPWTPEQRERLEAGINNKFGNGRQGRVWVVDGSFSFEPIEYSPADLGGLQITKTMRLTAANCFDVPISLLQAEDSNRAVAEAGNYQHQRNAIRPRCTAIASALTVMARQVDPRLFFAFDNPVEQDEARRAKVFDLRIRNNSLTINEARAEDGLPPVPWGDEPFIKAAPPALPGPGGDGAPRPGKTPPPALQDDDDEAADAPDPGDPEAGRLIAATNDLIRTIQARLDEIENGPNRPARGRRRGPGGRGDGDDRGVPRPVEATAAADVVAPG